MNPSGPEIDWISNLSLHYLPWIKHYGTKKKEILTN